jgi:hypothetical protein
MQDIVSEDLHKNPKRLWSYIKSRKQESSGITSLKNTDGYLHSDRVSKADILNKQFHSVYTKGAGVLFVGTCLLMDSVISC